MCTSGWRDQGSFPEEAVLLGLDALGRISIGGDPVNRRSKGTELAGRGSNKKLT